MKRKFDCVKFQREARRKLSVKYPESRNAELSRMLEEKYGHLRQRTALHLTGR